VAREEGRFEQIGPDRSRRFTDCGTVPLLRKTGRRHRSEGRVPAEIRKSGRREPSASARSPPTKARPSTAMPTMPTALRSTEPHAPQPGPIA